MNIWIRAALGSFIRAMRHLAVICLLGLVIGCSDQGPALGAVRWTVDGATCNGSGTILFFVDGEQIGSELMAAGQSSEDYPVEAGRRAIGARAGDDSLIWPSMPADVIEGETFVALLTC